MDKEKMFYNATDVAEMLSVSRPTAYRIIKRLNEDLQKSGYIIISGRIPVKYFKEKLYA